FDPALARRAALGLDRRQRAVPARSVRREGGEAPRARGARRICLAAQRAGGGAHRHFDPGLPTAGQGPRGGPTRKAGGRRAQALGSAARQWPVTRRQTPASQFEEKRIWCWPSSDMLIGPSVNICVLNGVQVTPSVSADT